jgi:UDP-N-acetylmuramoyl-L-alanyl-D-glutamate--2,6-diaminopimelate ligase
MKLDQLIKALGGVTVSGTGDREIAGVVCDSRQVRPGFLFAAIHGSSRDGGQFVDDALARGAAAVLSSEPALPHKDVTWIQSPGVRRALSLAACCYHGDPAARLAMVGITGTNGKTTTAYLAAHILEAAQLSPGLLTTVEYRIGDRTIPAGRTTPEAPILQSFLAQMVHVGCRSAVMEVSSHALDQMRTAGIEFDVAVFTNLSRDHLDYHQTLENYFAAKSLLFENLGGGRKKAYAVIHCEDAWGRKLVARVPPAACALTYGLTPEAMVRAEGLSLRGDGSSFRAVTPWGEAPVSLRLRGRYNVCNALAAIAACGALGVNVKSMAEALATMTVVPGRLEEVPTRHAFQVFVDYAHTDDALEKVLSTLREVTRGRLLVVFGCGGNRDTTKREPMGRIVSELADYAIITSDNPRREEPLSIMKQIRAGFGRADACELIEDRAAAIRRALQLAAAGDVVLVAGKGHETFQELATTKIPFDDRAVVRRELDQL